MTTLAPAYALSGANLLVPFNPADPAVPVPPIPVTGLTAGQTLVGIDFRPANGLLYGLGVNSAANTATPSPISALTGVATVVGSIGPLAQLDLSTASGFGFDFNPVVDRIRVTTDTGENFRINPNNGTLAGLDSTITPAGSEISGVAYTNNETNNSGVTTLYTFDSNTGRLMIQGFLNMAGGPNGGTQTPVGPVGVNFSTVNGFDIPAGVDTSVANAGVPFGSGLALLTVGGTVQLYSINLVTGAGTLIDPFVPFPEISGLAIRLPAGPFPLPTLQLSAFGPDAGGWSSNDTYPRTLADVNGDGMADIIGFSSAGVFESLATGGGHFAAPTFELAAFGVDAGGWSSNDTYPRVLADVNGDTRADIVAFSSAGVFESLATGNGDFMAPTFELAAFGTNAGGWGSDNTYPRALADVDGDGMADIVGFGADGVHVSLAIGGGHFAAPTFELAAFGTNAGGWSSNDTYPRALADVDGDGMADIVGFGADGVFVSLATGGGSFAAPAQKFVPFGASADR